MNYQALDPVIDIDTRACALYLQAPGQISAGSFDSMTEHSKTLPKTFS